jgi:hypothetical protein
MGSLGGGALAQLPWATQAEVWHTQLMQPVSLPAASSYALCVRTSSSLPGGVLQFAIDQAKAPWAAAGGAPRRWLGIPTDGSMAASCFHFTLPAGPTYKGRAVIDLGWAVGDTRLCEASLVQCTP